MSIITAQRTMTPDDLLGMPGGGKGYELVDGTLVALKSSARSSWIAGQVLYRIGKYQETRPLGWVFPPGVGFHCFAEDLNRVRKPDVSFVRFGRFPGESLPKGFSPIAPDLAVEVISPDDLADEVEAKLADYRRAGVRLVWIVYPSTQTILIHRPDGTFGRLTENDEIDGEDILPGFRIPIRDFFSWEPSIQIVS